MIRPLLLAALLTAGAAAGAQTLRPVARPLPEAPLRPAARPDVAAEAKPAEPDLAALSAAAPARELPPAAEPALAMRPRDRADLALQPVAAPIVRQLWSESPTWLSAQPMAKAPLAPPLRPRMPWMDVVQEPARAVAGPGASDPGFTAFAVGVAFRPPERPAGVAAEAERVKAERARGQICSTPELQGEALGTVEGPGACGVEDAVRVRAVGGVRLSTPATMDCATARSLLAWVQTGAIPAVGDTGGGLAGLRIAGHYACRGRNNVAGARLSEHAFGRAVDIAAFQLRDGSEVSVLSGWGSRQGDTLRQMWRAACGPFGTVLGPNANAMHRDHFHFDTARYRSGSYCR